MDLKQPSLKKRGISSVGRKILCFPSPGSVFGSSAIQTCGPTPFFTNRNKKLQHLPFAFIAIRLRAVLVIEYNQSDTNLSSIRSLGKFVMPKRLAFVGGTAVLADRVLPKSVIVCDGDRIVAIDHQKAGFPEDAQVVDCNDHFVLPGFVDIHVHGGRGADFMDGSRESVTTVCQAHAAHGTTTIFPTTTTGSSDQIIAMLSACKDVSQRPVGSYGASIAGVHLYGPFFAPDKAGCHEANHCRIPQKDEFQSYFATGLVRIATCAAELQGADTFYSEALAHNCLITCGHSNASWNEMQAAFDRGMRHVDHFWCAMSNVSSVRKRLGVPMQGSMLEFVIDRPEMSTEVIADGMHLSAELLRFAWKIKGAKRLCLVTDSNRGLDMPPGRYRFGNKQDGTWFSSDGQVGWASSDSLSSSVKGMDHMIRTMHFVAKIPLEDCVRMASLTPAERTGIDSLVGSI